MSVIVKLKDVRLSFPNLWTAKDYQNDGKFAYNAKFMQKDSQPVFKKLENGTWEETTVGKVLEEVAKQTWNDKATGVLKILRNDKKQMCWLDGDTSGRPEYEGMYVLSAKRLKDAGAPLVQDSNGSALNEGSGKPYSGCYVNATVEIWAQDNKYGKALRAKLRGVQFVRDGEAFSGAVPLSQDEFEPLGSDDELS